MSMDISDSLPDTGKDIIQIKVIDDSVEILLSNWKVFPRLYGRFLDGEIACTDRCTLGIEEMGEQLREKDGNFISFFEHVKEWGGKTRYFIEMNIKKYDTKEEKIVKSICDAMEFLQKEKIEIKKEIKKEYIKNAIEEIIKPKGLGISYGSKILRMLAPQQVGVYDSVLAKCLPYKNNSKDYADFCIDCRDVVGKLNDKPDARKEEDHCGKTEGGKDWRVADVEAVLFLVCQRDKKIIKTRKAKGLPIYCDAPEMTK